MRSLAVLILHNIARVSATNKKLIHEFSHLLKGQQNRISLNGPIFDRHVVVPTKNVFFFDELRMISEQIRWQEH